MQKTIYNFIRQKFNIGSTQAKLICFQLGLKINFNIKNLKKNQFNKLIFLCSKINLKFELKKIFKIKQLTKLKTIPCFRSKRHNLFFPVNGQKTRNNAKTRKIRKII